MLMPLWKMAFHFYKSTRNLKYEQNRRWLGFRVLSGLKLGMVPGTGNGFPGTDGISREVPREIPGKEAITLVRFRLLFQSRVYGGLPKR